MKCYLCLGKDNTGFEQAVQEFETILNRIKDVKPRAGEWWQLLLAVGLAEDMHEYMLQKLTVEVQSSQEKKSSLLLTGSLFNTSPTLPPHQISSSHPQDRTVIKMGVNK